MVITIGAPRRWLAVVYMRSATPRRVLCPGGGTREGVVGSGGAKTCLTEPVSSIQCLQLISLSRVFRFRRRVTAANITSIRSVGSLYNILSKVGILIEGTFEISLKVFFT